MLGASTRSFHAAPAIVTPHLLRPQVSRTHGFVEAEHPTRDPRTLFEPTDAAPHSQTMSLNTALARVELEYLSDVARDNSSVIKDLDHISTLQEDGIGGAFQKSLRVKSMIDELEIEAQERPSWKTLAALIRSEYRLWTLNEETPLRHNPFLSHWVEAVPRLEAASQPFDQMSTTGDITAQDIAATRVEMIKRMLRSEGDATWIASATPRGLFDLRIPSIGLDIRPFIRILEEEGIYERSSIPSKPVTVLTSVTQHDIPAAERSSDASTAPQEPTNPTSMKPRKHTLQQWEQWKDSIWSKISSDPSFVFAELTHLPIALPALEFLTDLITHYSLKAGKIDNQELILNFTQHALRLIEHMGQSSTVNHETPAQTDIGIDIDDEHGREAQSRALRLLILFLKNLDKKGFVVIKIDEDNTLYYDLQGMYHSYMWNKEVREFKMSIEHGDTTEEGA